MARTFPQPEKKETPTQKLKRELAEAEAQRDGYQKEASSLRQQINGRLEETDSYKILAKQVDALTLDRKIAIEQRDRYKAQLQERNAELTKLKDQLDASVTAQNGTQGGTEAVEESLPENISLGKWQQEMAEKLREIYNDRNQNLKEKAAIKIVRIWCATQKAEEALGMLYDYILLHLPQESDEQDDPDTISGFARGKIEALQEKIKELEAKIDSTKTTEQYNSTARNYRLVDEQAKKIKELEDQLDTSVTAQNVLKSDLDKLAAEYTQATRHNARNAGRKPKLTADQEQEIKNLRSEGLNVRQIAAKMSCSTGLVCKILKNCINI